MDKKGFTLVELLAVIVILGILVSIVSASVLEAKKRANLEEAKKLESEIASFGPDVYMTNHKPGKYDMSELTEYGLDVIRETTEYGINKEDGNILGIKNPNGKGFCSAYLLITNDPELDFKGYIKCPGLYTTEGYEEPVIDDESEEESDETMTGDTDSSDDIGD